MAIRFRIPKLMLARVFLGTLAILCIVVAITIQRVLPCAPNAAVPPSLWLSGMLAIVGTAACAGAYGTSALWMHQPKVRVWRVLLTVLLIVWSFGNVAGWTTALVQASPADPPATVEPQAVLPDPCEHCESGEAPRWFCIIIGCW